MSTKHTETFITVAEAAKLAERSERQIRRYAADGRLPSQQTAEGTLVERAAVLELKRNGPAPPPNQQLATMGRNRAVQDALQLLANKAAGALPAPASDEPAASTSPWITVAEAAKRYGLPQVWLLEMCRADAIDAVQVLRGERGDRWLIHREALEDRGLAERWRTLHHRQALHAHA